MALRNTEDKLRRCPKRVRRGGRGQPAHLGSRGQSPRKPGLAWPCRWGDLSSFSCPHPRPDHSTSARGWHQAGHGLSPISQPWLCQGTRPWPAKCSAHPLSSSIMDSAPSPSRTLAESAGSGPGPVLPGAPPQLTGLGQGLGPSCLRSIVRPWAAQPRLPDPQRHPLPRARARLRPCPEACSGSPRVRGRGGLEERRGSPPLRPRPQWGPRPWTRAGPDLLLLGQRKDILEELTKSQKVFSEKLDHLSRRLAWVHATVYSQVSGAGPAVLPSSPSVPLPPGASGTHTPSLPLPCPPTPCHVPGPLSPGAPPAQTPSG